MTEQQAKQMLSELAQHYKCPVMPVTEYCRKLREWATVANDAKILTYDAYYGVRLAITKSNLLYRTIYLNEELRTTPCPNHNGHWSGIEWGDSTEGNVCPHGCQLTGWLPNAND